MQRITRRTLMAALALSWLAGAAAQHVRAEEIFAITPRFAGGVVPSLFSFDSAAPGVTSTPLPLTGIGPQILGIDFRPATGELYGVGSDNRLFTIDTATGAATAVATISPNPGGIDLGLDFSPTTDELRAFVRGPEGAFRRNARINPDTGAAVFETELRYAPGDPRFGLTPNVLGLAYSNNVAGAGVTTLYGIDGEFLVRFDPEGEGTLRTVGRLGPAPIVQGAPFLGFDISGTTGTAYASVTQITGPNALVAQLYTINLDTGAATFVGRIGDGTTRLPVIGISVAPAVIPEPASLLLLGTGLLGAGVATVRRRRGAGAGIGA